MFARIATEVAAEVFPDDPPRFLARTPHGYHDVDLIRRDVLAAGFAEVEIETIDGVSVAPSPRDPAIAYCQGTPLRAEIEARAAGRLAEVTDRVTAAITAACGSGEVAAGIRGHVVTAAG